MHAALRHGRAALVALLGGLAACGNGDEAGGRSRDDLVALTQAAGYFAEEDYRAAREVLAPLIDREEPDPMDLVRAAAVELEVQEFDRARELLERARELDPELPAVHFNLGRVATVFGELEEAIDHHRRAHELLPGDYPTHLAYANALRLLDRFEEAEPHYRELLAVGLDYSGSWYLTTLYRLGRLLIDGAPEPGDPASPQVAEGTRLLEEYEELKARGITVPQSNDLARGNLGSLQAPTNLGTSVPTPGEPPAPGRLLADVRDLGDLAGLAALTPIDEWEPAENAEDRASIPDHVGPQELLAWGPGGVHVLTPRPDGSAGIETAFAGPAEHALAFDLHEDRQGYGSDLDLWVVSGSELILLVNREGRYERSPLSPRALPGPPAELELVDYDHEGDLDLVAVGEFGVRLWRNDVNPLTLEGAFVEVSAEAGLPAGRAFAWCVVEDLDTDQDVDLLLGGRGGLHLADNLRGGLFGDESARLSEVAPTDDGPLVADLDGDALPDLLARGDPARLHRGTLSGTFAPGEDPGAPLGRRAAAADYDLDGALDAFWPPPRGGEPGLLGALALGLPQATGTELPVEYRLTAPVLADVDADLAVDVAGLEALGDDGVRLQGGTPGPNRGLRLALRGIKDNARGIGAVVELLAGPIYRRIYWRGEPQVVGLGRQAQLDVLRVTWPNGVVQYETNVPAGGHLLVEQKEGLIGSCPFLYTWNGEEFVFISDVLGITPLGLPMAPGRLVPPDHDEYVLVRGDQLAPRDGFYEIQITEELREVTYLDRVRLEVVDHPAGTQVWPDERFTFPPFPEPHLHTTRGLHAPVRATGSDGGDWAAELAAVDGEFAVPFEPLRGSFMGLATPHFLELEFDPEAVASAAKLRLLCTGWLYWTDASVNVAAARAPGLDFVPPLIQVPDPDGEGDSGWRDAGPPVGFPAGKTKTMVIDLAGILDPADPRLRLVSTLRLYWDAIRLATDGDDAQTRVTALEPESARLWERGYSEPVLRHPEHGLEWFEWELVECRPRWNQHPGFYTRYGEVLPLLTAIDDRFVILGAGDALTVRFPAADVPPVPEGWTRDYLVFFDGWAKDRDPNTEEALSVEPLPFHGMSGYPYGADESFPDDAEHRAWRREWNTRPSKQWIPPLAPRAGRAVR